MTTVSQARQVIRSRIEAGAVVDSDSTPVPFRWQNEETDSLGNVELPSPASPFVYVEFNADRASLASFGGGRGSNRYRNPARIEAFVFVPKGEGLNEAESIAEQIATLFRSYRDDDISCFDASVYPGGDGEDLAPKGMSSEVSNYFYCSLEVSLHFDLIG